MAEKRPIRGHKAGFTMVELLVALAVSTIVLLGIGKTFSISNRTYISQDQIAYTEQNLRGAIEIMAFELRMAGYIPLNNLEDGDDEITNDVSGPGWADGVFDKIEFATNNAIAISADLDPDDDPSTTENAETVLYQLNGTSLVRQLWQWNAGWTSSEGQVVLADNITNLNLQYTFKDGSTGLPVAGDPDRDRDAIRAVTITMTGRTDKMVRTSDGDPDFVRRTLQSVVMLRNMDLDMTAAQGY